MSTFPYRRKPSSPMEFHVAAGTAIEPGDFIWWNGTTLKSVGGSAANLVNTWTSEMKARRDATSRFVGVAEFGSQTDDKFDRTVAVKTSGVYDLPCASFLPKRGEFVGVKKASGNYLEAQTVQKVLHPYDAIGVVVRDYSAATMTVQVQLFSAWEFLLASRVETLPFRCDAALYAAGGNVVTDYTFGRKVRVLAITGVVEVLTAGASTTTLYNGANVLDETLVIPNATAAGTVIRREMVAATNPTHIEFEHDTEFDIVVDGTSTAGAVNYQLEIVAMPLLA